MPKEKQRDLTRSQRRDLDIEIGFLEGLVKRDPDFVEALQILGDDYTRRGRCEEGLEVDLRLARLRPEDPLIHYNLACSHSLAGQLRPAYETLCQAIDLGYRDFRWLSADPDLEAFRQDALYARLIQKIDSMRVEIG